MEACTVTAKFTGFYAEVIRRWAECVFPDVFFTSAYIDDIDDEVSEAELGSNRGKHPKWVSLSHDENFKLEATQYIREHGYVKGAPNITLFDFVRWVAEEWNVEVSSETACCLLHLMGFSYRQFSKGIYFDGHEREECREK